MYFVAFCNALVKLVVCLLSRDSRKNRRDSARRRFEELRLQCASVASFFALEKKCSPRETDTGRERCARKSTRPYIFVVRKYSHPTFRHII